MTKETPTSDLQQRFLRGETDRQQTADLVRSVLARTDAAGEPLTPPAAWEPAAREAGDYAAILDAAVARCGAWSRGVAAEEAEAPRRVSELLAASDGEALAASDPAFATWAVGSLLRRASQEACAEEPVRAVELARLAVAAADAERRRRGGADRLAEDLAALAWGQRANAERVASDLLSAEASLRHAFSLARAGTQDRLVRARLESWAATLRIDQSFLGEALTLARRAAGHYRAAEDRHAEGRTLLKVARALALQDELDEACATLLKALDLVDTAAEPRLAAVVQNNFASYLERMGRPQDADRRLDAVEELLDDLEASGRAKPLDRARLDWMRGRVAASLGHPERGEALLGRARQAFVASGVAFEASQVALELALLYAEAGRVEDQRRLAEEMLPIFTSRQLHAEARAALALYAQAARDEAVQSGLVRRLSDYLERARHHAGEPFRKS